MNHGKKALSILTVIQLVFFSVVLIAAIAIKLIGGPVYTAVHEWYTHALNDSILANPMPESSVSSEISSGGTLHQQNPVFPPPSQKAAEREASTGSGTASTPSAMPASGSSGTSAEKASS